MAGEFFVHVTEVREDDNVTGPSSVAAGIMKTKKDCAHVVYTTNWKGLEIFLSLKPTDLPTTTPAMVTMSAKAYILWKMRKMWPDHKPGAADIVRREGRIAYQKVVRDLFDTVVPRGHLAPCMCEKVDRICDGVIRAPAQRHVLDVGGIPKITVCAGCYDHWEPIDIEPLCGWYGAIMDKWAELEGCSTIWQPSSADEPDAKKIKLDADTADTADAAPPQAV